MLNSFFLLFPLCAFFRHFFELEKRTLFPYPLWKDSGRQSKNGQITCENQEIETVPLHSQVNEFTDEVRKHSINF